ncbi:putative hydroxypyruvate isomerase [Strongylocentrotus purpuratus]|uniref:Putative hydroxypyruvate isomerase n=1 Tax=Strongylocentrotus purpuratus TaxID=7668 RepID=A0A7M7GNL2_STRPU|nr:putative hydroxypyruvate isomerase [Strongylocentrotus purpuratus]|eukprot:XP_003724004.1 PREDICTED: putative hydroxypyruvate isomerase [Strongylocentrotus purpuratus]
MPLKFAANISIMFTELPSFASRYAAAKTAGFQAVECVFPFEFSKDEIASARKQAEVEHVLMSSYPGDRTAGEFGLAALPGRQKEFRETLELSIEYCKALCCKRMHVMSGRILAHEEGQRSSLLSQMEETLVENLKYAANRLLREDIIAVIEPINDRYTIPNYFLTRQDQAVDIIKRVGCDNVKLQLDIYHVQLVHGDLTRIIKEYMPYVGHIQVSQAPGRNEPSLKGEIDYDYIFDVLEKSGYDGWIGAEYKPSTGNTEDSLAWFQRFR